MKYIKYFENIEPKLYWKIDIDSRLYDTSVNMSRSLSDLLLTLLKKYIPKVAHLDNSDSYIQCKTSGVEEFPSLNFIMELPDEYFLISVREDEEFNYQNHWYMCDSKDGVMELLKYKKLIKV